MTEDSQFTDPALILAVITGASYLIGWYYSQAYFLRFNVGIDFMEGLSNHSLFSAFPVVVGDWKATEYVEGNVNPPVFIQFSWIENPHPEIEGAEFVFLAHLLGCHKFQSCSPLHS